MKQPQETTAAQEAKVTEAQELVTAAAQINPQEQGNCVQRTRWSAGGLVVHLQTAD